MKKYSNKENEENFEKYLNELEGWMQGSCYNGSLEFAFRNGFLLHAVSLWVGSGASSLSLPLRISHKEEMKEVSQLCRYADIFICPDCNHHSFFQPGEIEDDSTGCESCLKTMKIHSRGT